VNKFIGERLYGIKRILQSFDQEHVKDLNRLELSRLYVLIATFGALWLIAASLQYFTNVLDGHIYTGQVSKYINLYYIMLLVFFSLQLWFAKRKIKAKSNFSLWYLYATSFIELALYCGFAILLSNIVEDTFFIKSLFIMHLLFSTVLSTMRLKLFLSTVMGIFGAVSYFYISKWGAEKFLGEGAFDDMRFAFYAIIILLFGFIADYLGFQIFKRIIKTLDANKEINELEKIFGQQLNPKIVEELSENSGEYAAKQVLATIMFFDIRNFTEFAESRTAQEVFKHQNLIFDPLIKIVDKHDGLINQITGDGFMAVFGITSKASDHVNNAFKAGLEIIESVNHMSKTGKIEPTRAGVGLQTGKLIVGNIGNEVRKQFSISGINVIVAARLEKLNKKHGSSIIISDDVKQKLTGFNNQLTSLGYIDVRGFDEPILAFKVD